MLRLLAPVACSLLIVSPAFADLTAEDVLADHLNLLSGYGTLDMTTTNTTASASGLAVEGFVGSYTDEETTIEIRMPGMVLTETPDGSVDITYDDTLPITIYADPEDEEPRSVTLTLQTEGLTHNVSGRIGDLTHKIAFDTLTISEFTVDPPEAAEELNFEGDIAVAGLASTIRLNDGEPAQRSVNLTLAGLTMAMSVLAPTDIGIDTPGTTYDASGVGEMDITFALSNLSTFIGYTGGDLPHHSMQTTLGRLQMDQSSDLPDQEGGMSLALTSSDFALSYDIQANLEALEGDFLQALLDGQRISGALNFSDLAYDFDIDTPEGAIATATSNGPSETRFSFSQHGLAFFSTTEESTVEISGPITDFPVNSFGYGVERSFIDLALPLTPSEDLQSFHTRFDLIGLTIDDALWDIVDPARRLSREGADLSFDLEGETVIFEDPFTTDSEPPFRDTEATLKSFRLSIAGAKLTGSGKVKDTSTPGKPAGVGELDMTLVGINTLIDTLVDMGLLPNEQAMGARMGLGLIARPGDGEDTLVSKIEVNEDGQIFANGQRIK